MPANGQSETVPAHLSLLAIYNPRLGTTDETLHDQIVFYHSVPKDVRSPSRGDQRCNEVGNQSGQENENEKLRQIGLAQGMVSFAKWVLIFPIFRARFLEMLIPLQELFQWTACGPCAD